MLRRLEIKNLAVIERAAIDFSAGLNVLTGETGAGKSIVIEALGFLLGGRASASWLRAGAERLEVEGLFDSSDFPAKMREQFGIVASQVVLRRELDAGGKTRALLGGRPIPLSVLTAWSEGMVDFHGQHEHQALLKPSVQLDSLDRFGELETAEVSALYRKWSSLCAQRDAAQMSDEERRRRLDRVRLESDEIAQANPRTGEEEELQATLPLLQNAERLKSHAAAAYGLLYEQEPSVQGQLLKVERSLSELARIDPSMSEALSALSTARLSLEDVTHRVGSVLERQELDPERVDGILGRLEQLSRLKKKYGATIEDVLAYAEGIRAEAARLENWEEGAKHLETEIAALQETLDEACDALHQGRIKAAKKLQSAVLKQLKALGMPSATFEIAVEMEEGRYSSSGADAVEFLIGPNPGESPKSLKAVASGGELSRVMLALKSVLAASDRVPVLVFDEVDAGVGGVVARAVGQRLAALAGKRQVLCVTHLPQVACFGQSHFHVTKTAHGGRTRMAVEALSPERRLETIARMLGGMEATEASRRHARELLESSSK